MKKRLKIICAVTAVGLTVVGMEKRPSIIVVLTDDQGFGQLPVYSDTFPDEMLFLSKNTERYACDEQKAKTAAKACMPNLQALAANGVTFMNAHVTSPVCGPSRAALLTGRYQQRFGVYDNSDLSNAGVPLSETMLPKLFQQAGYRTAMIGKWHLGKTTKEPLPVQTHDYHKNAIVGCVPEQNPINLGFDHYFGFNSSGASYFDSPSLFRGLKNVKTERYITDEFTDDALKFIRESGDDPFFVYLAYNAPHIPLEEPAPAPYQRFDTGNREVDNYYAYVAAVDDGIGRIISLLRERGELDSTLIFYLSDNGAVIESPQPMNGPFRGNKGNFNHGGMHVPMIAHWPTGLKTARFEPRVSSLDVLPTALAAAGISLPENLDGVDLRSFLEQNSAPHEALYWAGPEIMHWSGENKVFWREYREYVAERSNDAPTNPDKAGEASWAVLKGPWLLRCNEVTGKVELFDVQGDVGESSEVSATHPEVVESLRHDYRKWSSALGKPLVWNMDEYERLTK